MKSVKGTETEKNLLKAFAGESQARNRYSFYASQAKKEGYPQIEAIFLETADNERLHAKRLFKFLEGGELEIMASYPAGKIGTTIENLQESINGEHYENTTMYPEFAEKANEEGFSLIAAAFKAIANAEVHHENRFKKLLDAVTNNTTIKKNVKVTWICSKCGYIHEGTEPPPKCPACEHDASYFVIFSENY